MLDLVLKLGRLGTVVSLTVTFVLTSVSIAWGTSSYLTMLECDPRLMYVLSAGIPALLTPGAAWLLVSAVHQLHAARQEAERMAMYDSLTPALTRRAFYAQCEGFYALARRQQTGFAVAYFDCDDFKQINDRVGHAGGDAVLIDLATVVRGRLRQNDLLARLGGDEFLVAVSDVDTDRAEQIFEDIRARVAARRLDHGGHGIGYSVSIGVAVAGPQHYPALEQLVIEADHALYEAKRQGRNRVSLYRSETA